MGQISLWGLMFVCCLVFTKGLGIHLLTDAHLGHRYSPGAKGSTRGLMSTWGLVIHRRLVFTRGLGVNLHPMFREGLSSCHCTQPGQ